MYAEFKAGTVSLSRRLLMGGYSILPPTYSVLSRAKLIIQEQLNITPVCMYQTTSLKFNVFPPIQMGAM